MQKRSELPRVSSVLPCHRSRRSSGRASRQLLREERSARFDGDSSIEAVSLSVMQSITSESAWSNQRDIPQLREGPGPSGLQFSEDSSNVSLLEVMEEYVENWVQSLDHEDRKSVSMLLCLILVKELSFTETRAAKLAAKVLKINDKTVQELDSTIKKYKVAVKSHRRSGLESIFLLCLYLFFSSKMSRTTIYLSDFFNDLFQTT